MFRARHVIALGAVVSLGAAPAARAQVAGLSGTIVVTNKTPSTATIIDVASGRALAVLPTGKGPHEIALSRDGRTAVVTDYGGADNTLTVIDVPGRRVVRKVPMGEYRRPHGITFLPGDSLVLVTSEASGNVVVVAVGESAGVRRAVATGAPGSHMVGVTADAARAYTGNIGGNSVSALDLRAGTIVRTIAVPAQPEAINVTPDGGEVWVGSNATGRISVVDPAAGTVTTAAEGFGWPYRVLFTPDRRTVILPDLKNQEVRFLDRATHRELGRIAFAGGGPQGVALTPDGRYLFQSLSTGARVAIVDVAARRVVGYVPAGETPDGVVYTSLVVRP